MARWYEDYLASDHWQQTRAAKLEAAEWMCERCGLGAKRRPWAPALGLNVHHLTYERVGAELIDDLVVLCIHCHQVEHGLAPDTERNRIKIARRLAARVLESYEDELGWV